MLWNGSNDRHDLNPAQHLRACRYYERNLEPARTRKSSLSVKLLITVNDNRQSVYRNVGAIVGSVLVAVMLVGIVVVVVVFLRRQAARAEENRARIDARLAGEDDILVSSWQPHFYIAQASLNNYLSRRPVAAISSKQWGATWRARSASLYRGLGAEPPAGVQGQSPWSGGQGAKPP